MADISHEKTKDHLLLRDFNIVFRVNMYIVTYSMGFGFLTKSLISIQNNGSVYKRLDQMLIAATCLISLVLWRLADNCTYEYKKAFMLFYSEVSNILFWYNANFLYPEHSNVFLICAMIQVYSQQILIVQTISATLFINFKFFFMWYFSQLVTGQIPFPEVPSPFILSSQSILLIGSLKYLMDSQHSSRIVLIKQLSLLKAQRDGLIQAIPDALLVCSQTGETYMANQQFKQQFQCSSDVECQELLQCLAINGNSLACIVSKYLEEASGQSRTLGTTSFTHRLYEWRISKVQWENTWAGVLICRDVTDIAQIERIQSESDFKTLLLRSASHELKTPSNAIIYYSGQIQQSPVLDECLRYYIDIVHSSSKYLLHIINDVLDLAKISNEQFKIDKKWIELIPFIVETLHVLEYKAKESEIRTQLQFDDSLQDRAYTDPARLAQVLLNLYSNAIKYAPKGNILIRVIQISLVQIELQVIDDGIGISPESQEAIFQEYGRVRNEVDTQLNPQSVGLGLFITRKIVEQLGGYIWVDSELGKGSTFAVIIPTSSSFTHSSQIELTTEHTPIQLPYHSSPPKLNPQKKQPRHTHIDVLIVDDDVINRKILTEALQKANYKTQQAGNGQDAVDLILTLAQQKQEVKVVLMDCEMPILNGWAATRLLHELAQTEQLAKLPVIIGCTGFNDEETLKACHDCGMQQVICKPVDIGKLLSILQVTLI